MFAVMLSRRTSLVIGFLAIGLGALLWFNYLQQRQERPNLLSGPQLAALADDQIEPRLVNDIAQHLVYNGYASEAWRRLPERARHLWAVASVEEELSGFGLHRFLADQAKGGRGPGFADAIAGYEAMGLTETAGILSETEAYVKDHGLSESNAKATAADQAALKAFLARYLGSLKGEEIRKKRLAFLRQIPPIPLTSP